MTLLFVPSIFCFILFFAKEVAVGDLGAKNGAKITAAAFSRCVILMLLGMGGWSGGSLSGSRVQVPLFRITFFQKLFTSLVCEPREQKYEAFKSTASYQCSC